MGEFKSFWGSLRFVIIWGLACVLLDTNAVQDFVVVVLSHIHQILRIFKIKLLLN